MNNNEKYNIICFSNQLWDFPNWTNKRHVMLRLAKLGHNVLFVDPPINVGNVFFTQIKRGLWNIARLITQTKVDPCGAVIYTPLNLISDIEYTTSLHIRKIKSLASKNFDPSRKTLLWIYHVQLPHLEKYLAELSYNKLIYDCVDNYAAFPVPKGKYKTVVYGEELERQEKMLAQKANIVFTTAPGLVDKMKEYSQHVVFTPNVGDYEKFHNAKEITDIPEDIKNIPHPIIGFTGALDSYKFDLELFKKTVTENPTYSFVLIGQFALKDAEASLESVGLSEFKNVYFLGYKPFDIIQTYMAAFDAFIIPYQLNDYTVGGCFPIKFHDALAVGIPVVVTDMPAYYPFADVCYISKSYGDFSSNVNKCISEDSKEKMSARQKVAKENNWDGKVQKMLDLVQ